MEGRHRARPAIRSRLGSSARTQIRRYQDVADAKESTAGEQMQGATLPELSLVRRKGDNGFDVVLDVQQRHDLGPNHESSQLEELEFLSCVVPAHAGVHRLDRTAPPL